MKDEQLWNKIHLVVKIGDLVRFKHGKVEWHVLAISNLPKTDRQWIKLYRHRRGKMGRMVEIMKKVIG